MVSRRSRPAWGRVCLAGAVALAVVLVPRGPVVAQDLGAKLATVLADVAVAVPQQTPASPPTIASAPLSVTSLPKSAQDAIHGHLMRLDAAGAVQVSILMSPVSLDTLQQLTAAGATVQIPDAAHERVQAAVPIARLAGVAALPFVRFVTLPNYARRFTGSIDSEGDAIIHSDLARQQFNLDGTGVKVGVISDGLKGVFATGCTTNCGGVANGPIGKGDLPASTGTRSAFGVLMTSSGGITGQSFQSNGDLEGLPSGACGFAGAGAEGTALLEIVHDIAPGAQLSFSNADTDTAFNAAVNFLAANNDVVVDDLGFFDVPFDGTNLVSANTAAALNNNGNRIRAYVTAVGNDANDHYIGGYTDSGIDGETITGLTTPGDLHLFQSASTTSDVLSRGAQPYNLISLPQGGEVVVFLSWDDPAGHSANNYDLYLVQESTNTVVARSTNRQAGLIDPTEFVDYVNTVGSGLFRIVVQNVRNQAQAKTLNLIAFEPECANDGPHPLTATNHALVNYNTPMESVGAESDAGGSPVSVISVGAICSGSAASVAAFAGGQPDESCNDLTHSTVEFFSSHGPTLDGRLKPDMAAIDGVSITGAGNFELPFFGSSAAGPHVAGEAALLLEGASCLSTTGAGALDPVTARTNLRNLLVSSATALSLSPPDDVVGSGLANALAAVQRTLPIFGATPAVVVNGNEPNGARITASQLGFTDPDSCPLTRLNWTGGCGSSPDSAMTCPFGTTQVNVAASNGGLAFSPATALQVTVTGFGVSGNPGSVAVTAGQPAQFQVTVAAQGGPFTGSVTLGCSGLPQGAACVFSPSVVTPGTTSASSTLTITTTPNGTAVAEAGAHARRSLPPGTDRWPFTWFVVAFGVAGIVVQRRAVASRLRGVPAFAIGCAVIAVAAAPACGSSTSAASSGAVSLTATSLTFGSQSVGATSTPQGITISNTGTGTLTITGIQITGDFAETNTCGTTLGTGASCTATVTFAPTAAGSRTGKITVSDSASNSPQTISLSGTGVSATGPTPAGTYAVALNGSSGTLVKSGSVSLVVH